MFKTNVRIERTDEPFVSFGGALRHDPKNGCEGDQRTVSLRTQTDFLSLFHAGEKYRKTTTGNPSVLSTLLKKIAWLLSLRKHDLRLHCSLRYNLKINVCENQFRISNFACRSSVQDISIECWSSLNLKFHHMVLKQRKK